MINKTGTYKLVNGKLEKISDRVPNTQVFDCYVPEGGYYSENLCPDPGKSVFVKSRQHKRALMKAQGVRETNDKLASGRKEI